jgi:hypothetical protein
MTIPQVNIHIMLINVRHMLIAPFIAKSTDLVDEYCKLKVFIESWLILLTEKAHNRPFKINETINLFLLTNIYLKSMM